LTCYTHNGEMIYFTEFEQAQARGWLRLRTYNGGWHRRMQRRLEDAWKAYCKLRQDIHASIHFGHTRLVHFSIHLPDERMLRREHVNLLYARLRLRARRVYVSTTDLGVAFGTLDEAEEIMAKALPYVRRHMCVRSKDEELYYRSPTPDAFRRRIDTARKRRARPASSTRDSQQVEYVYDWHPSYLSGYVIYRHRIIKKTKKFYFVTKGESGHVYVERGEDWSTKEWSGGRDQWQHEELALTDVIRLDRAEIEGSGAVFHSGRRTRFYKDLSSFEAYLASLRGPSECPPHLMEPLAALGLSWPIDEQAVKSAYRKLARQYHPDRNVGNAEAEAKFKEVQRAYERVRPCVKATIKSEGA
jgi:hypothetical protein